VEEVGAIAGFYQVFRLFVIISINQLN